MSGLFFSCWDDLIYLLAIATGAGLVAGVAAVVLSIFGSRLALPLACLGALGGVGTLAVGVLILVTSRPPPPTTGISSIDQYRASQTTRDFYRADGRRCLGTSAEYSVLPLVTGIVVLAVEVRRRRRKAHPRTRATR